MTLRPSRFVLPLFVAATLATPVALSAADEAILIVDQSVGGVGVQRDGKRLTLPRGAALQEQDLIVTERNGRLSLRLGRHGFVEVGPEAEVGVERLPFAAFARDLKSIFSIGKGYFRVVWKHPQLSSNWPLYVYMLGHRVSLSSGEYFFQNLGSSQRACVAAGQIALQAASGDGVETIKPPACVELSDTAAPKVVPRNPDDWIAVRRGFNLEATAAAAVASVAPSAAPTAAPVVPPAPAALPAAPPLPVAPAKPAVVTAPLIIGEVRTLPPRAPGATPTTAGKGWALNAASYTEAALAAAEAERLRAAGFANVSTQPATINGKVWHRVQIGGFNDEPSARAAAVELKNKLGLQNVWVLKP